MGRSVITLLVIHSGTALRVLSVVQMFFHHVYLISGRIFWFYYALISVIIVLIRFPTPLSCSFVKLDSDFRELLEIRKGIKVCDYYQILLAEIITLRQPPKCENQIIVADTTEYNYLRRKEISKDWKVIKTLLKKETTYIGYCLFLILSLHQGWFYYVQYLLI